MFSGDEGVMGVAFPDVFLRLLRLLDELASLLTREELISSVSDRPKDRCTWSSDEVGWSYNFRFGR